jgi:NTE family protein
VDVAQRRTAAAALRLIEKLPPALREHPDTKQLVAGLRSTCASLDIVHLIYRAKQYENHAKDYEFSRLTMSEHWAIGQADVLQTLHDPRWTGRGPAEHHGVRVFDLVGPQRTAAVAAHQTLQGALAHEAD